MSAFWDEGLIQETRLVTETVCFIEARYRQHDAEYVQFHKRWGGFGTESPKQKSEDQLSADTY